MGSNVELGGLTGWKTRQITLTSTAATQLDSTPLAGRNGLEIAPSTANTARVFISPSSSVSATTGRGVGKVSGPVYLALSTRGKVWGKAASGSQVVFVTEIG